MSNLEVLRSGTSLLGAYHSTEAVFVKTQFKVMVEFNFTIEYFDICSRCGTPSPNK